MIVYFTPKKYDLNVIPTEAIPARRGGIYWTYKDFSASSRSTGTSLEM